MFNVGFSSCYQKASHKLYMLASVFGVLLFLSGCGIIKSAELQALEDAASVLQLTTGREVSRSLRDKGTALGKPVYAEIIIEYEPVNSHTRKEVFDEIITILEKNNWKGDEWNIVPGYFSMSLKEGGIAILAEALIRSNENLVRLTMTNRNR